MKDNLSINLEDYDEVTELPNDCRAIVKKGDLYGVIIPCVSHIIVPCKFYGIQINIDNGVIEVQEVENGEYIPYNLIQEKDS